jgi:hypothetical protein
MEFVQNYFQAEVIESIVIVALGSCAVLFSLYCWFIISNAFVKGLAIPLILGGLIQLMVGVTIFLRSEKDAERVENFLVLEPQEIINQEIPRMERVMRNVKVYRYAEFALMLAGIAFMIARRKSETIRGIGLGLVIQASAMLVADHIAERRGEIYLKELNTKVSDHQKHA